MDYNVIYLHITLFNSPSYKPVQNLNLQIAIKREKMNVVKSQNMQSNMKLANPKPKPVEKRSKCYDTVITKNKSRLQ